MSYDVHVRCHTCGHDLMEYASNMTSNVSPVWNKAGAPLKDWNDKIGVDVLPQLQAAIANLSCLDSYERLQYDDLVRGAGEWGTVDDALAFLVTIRDAICRDPWAHLSVHR